MAVSFKIQGSADEYTMFVIDSLVGIHGKSKSEVVTTLLRFWIRQNADFLEKNDLSIKDWKKTRNRK